MRHLTAGLVYQVTPVLTFGLYSSEEDLGRAMATNHGGESITYRMLTESNIFRGPACPYAQ